MSTQNITCYYFLSKAVKAEGRYRHCDGAGAGNKVKREPNRKTSQTDPKQYRHQQNTPGGQTTTTTADSHQTLKLGVGCGCALFATKWTSFRRLLQVPAMYQNRTAKQAKRKQSKQPPNRTKENQLKKITERSCKDFANCPAGSDPDRSCCFNP